MIAEKNNLKVSVDLFEAQEQIANVMWEKRKNGRNYYIHMGMKVVLAICMVVLCIDLYRNFSIGNNKLVYENIFVILISILGLIYSGDKIQKKRFLEKNHKIAQSVVNKNKGKIISYELSEQCIVRNGFQETIIEWKDISGYFFKDGWLGMAWMPVGRTSKFVMIPYGTLQKDECDLLEHFLNTKVQIKEINWKMICN